MTRSAHKFRLGLETLETRDTPAVFIDGTSLWIGGHTFNQAVNITVCQYAQIDQTASGIRISTNTETVDIPTAKLTNDFIYYRGKPGNDYVNNNTAYTMSAWMGDRNDFAWGGTGADQLVGGAGDDTFRGWTGDDFLYGEDGNDRLEGEEGNDQPSGGRGDDTLMGGDGADYLYGDDGNDTLYGATATRDDAGAPDALNGGDGADSFYCSSGRDICTGTENRYVSGWTLIYDHVYNQNTTEGDWRD
jgi:Ca2+-binding RTX toxin-like protein